MALGVQYGIKLRSKTSRSSSGCVSSRAIFTMLVESQARGGHWRPQEQDDQILKRPIEMQSALEDRTQSSNITVEFPNEWKIPSTKPPPGPVVGFLSLPVWQNLPWTLPPLFCTFMHQRHSIKFPSYQRSCQGSGISDRYPMVYPIVKLKMKKVLKW